MALRHLIEVSCDFLITLWEPTPKEVEDISAANPLLLLLLSTIDDFRGKPLHGYCRSQRDWRIINAMMTFTVATAAAGLTATTPVTSTTVTTTLFHNCEYPYFQNYN